MMYMILFVLHDPAKLPGVLDAWQEAGVSGITILASTGLGRLKKSDALREDLPLIPSLEDLLRSEEQLNRTLFSIVENDALVDKVVQATEELIGDLNNPNTGILTVIPITRAYGLHRKTNGDT